jgi:ribosome-associated protein
VLDVPIRGDMIRLGQLLKLEGVIDSGAGVKAFLAAEAVWVNGEREARRGRQLHPGDIVRVGERELRLTSADPPLDPHPDPHPDPPPDPPPDPMPRAGEP